MRAVFGADPVISGEIWLDGKAVSFRSPKNAIDSGIALCPEDRKEQGLIWDGQSGTNISIPVLSKMRKRLFLDVKKEKA
jgi:ABC-type sugar transport system ATPase subunit